MLASTLGILLIIAAAGLVLVTIALALQVAATLLLSDRPFPVSSCRPSIAVLIPAHNEEKDIGATVLRIKEDLSPADRLLVVADNCTDETGPVAKRAGAEIVVRDDAALRGKGFALAAGLRHLAMSAPDVVVFVDADCQLSPHGLELLARACVSANAPVQCLNLMIANPASNAPPRLAEFAWRIKNDLRPNGYARLGLPCHLLGTGMALPWTLISAEMFMTGHLAEDLLFGLELAVKGFPARFFRRATVISYFPITQPGQDKQRQRWLHGHLGLMLTHCPRLTYQALRHRNLGLLALAADLAVPPLAVLAGADMMLLTASLTYMIATGAFTSFGLSVLASTLLATCLAIAWYTCGRDLIGRREFQQLPRHVFTVMRSAFNLAFGHRTRWIRADRL